MKKVLSLASCVTITLLCQQASAVVLNDDFDAVLDVTLASDYRSNGVSMTGGDPALQTLASLVHKPSGLSVSLWYSTFDLGTRADAETGYMVGYSHTLTNDISFNGYLGRFEYPRQSEYDVTELSGTLNAYGFFANYVYDWGEKPTPDAKYRYVGYNYTLPYDVLLTASVGNHDMGYGLVSGDGGERTHYNTKSVSIARPFFGMDFSLTYIDTDLSKNECLYISLEKNSCSAGVIAAVHKAF